MNDPSPPSWIEAAIEQFESPLLRYAMHFVHDLEAARDIVQDTFMKLCQQSEIEMRPKLAKWLYTVCRNRAIDVSRKERRMKLSPEYEITDQISSQNNSNPPDAAMEQVELAAGLMAQIERLSNRQQEVLRLKFSGDLSYREIAEVTGLTVSHVGVTLHEAITKLRTRMSE